ncbi:MAG: lipopolysaccharide transport periplasmic protein LptA [Pseudomonadota bacterium]
MCRRSLWKGGLVLAFGLHASLAGAQADGPFGGFKHDNTAPIEITSDALEVRQAEQLAIFSGNVIAGQGTMRLTADRLNVFYREQGSDSNSSASGDTGAIERIDAVGNVFLCNGAETAQGSTGTYNVKSGKVSMAGNVVLTQGGNAIAGPTLEIDLNTGVGKVTGGGNSGRVTSVFTPSTAESAEPKSAPCGGL